MDIIGVEIVQMHDIGFEFVNVCQKFLGIAFGKIALFARKAGKKPMEFYGFFVADWIHIFTAVGA